MNNNTAFHILSYLNDSLDKSEYNHPIITKFTNIKPLIEHKTDYITALLLNENVSVNAFYKLQQIVKHSHFIEEELIIKDFFSIFEEIANVTGAAVSTDTPKISVSAAEKYKKRFPTFDVDSNLFSKFSGKSVGREILGGLNLESYNDKMIYNFLSNNPSHSFVIKHSNNLKLLNQHQ